MGESAMTWDLDWTTGQNKTRVTWAWTLGPKLAMDAAATSTKSPSYYSTKYYTLNWKET